MQTDTRPASLPDVTLATGQRMTAREYQIALVASSTYRLTPEQHEAIADRCLAAKRRGDSNISVWHHAAQYFGSPCQCYECAESRKAVA